MLKQSKMRPLGWAAIPCNEFPPKSRRGDRCSQKKDHGQSYPQAKEEVLEKTHWLHLRIPPPEFQGSKYQLLKPPSYGFEICKAFSPNLT